MARLGAPAYSFQYKAAGEGGTKTISGLNLSTSENDDGITPLEFNSFLENVAEGLGITLDGGATKFSQNQMILPDGGE